MDEGLNISLSLISVQLAGDSCSLFLRRCLFPFFSARFGIRRTVVLVRLLRLFFCFYGAGLKLDCCGFVPDGDYGDGFDTALSFCHFSPGIGARALAYSDVGCDCYDVGGGLFGNGSGRWVYDSGCGVFESFSDWGSAHGDGGISVLDLFSEG